MVDKGERKQGEGKGSLIRGQGSKKDGEGKGSLIR